MRSSFSFLCSREFNVLINGQRLIFVRAFIRILDRRISSQTNFFKEWFVARQGCVTTVENDKCSWGALWIVLKSFNFILDVEKRMFCIFWVQQSNLFWVVAHTMAAKINEKEDRPFPCHELYEYLINCAWVPAQLFLWGIVPNKTVLLFDSETFSYL